MSLRLLSLSAILLFIIGSVFAPVADAAKKSKANLSFSKKRFHDEKVVISNPVSRCTTADFQKMHTHAVAQAQADFESVRNGKEDDPTMRKAFQGYTQDIALAWEAMQQPYCGYGSHGAAAAKKSFQKTLTRVRADFFSQTKIKVVAKTSVSAKSKTVHPQMTLTHTLKRGMRSDEIKTLQDILVKKDLMEEEYATGYFGEMTEKGVIKFQKKRGIILSERSSIAGIVGPRTRTELMR